MTSVLIVDDEPLVRELHRTFVSRLEGFDVVAEAENASAAYRAVHEAAVSIDLILLDVNLPDATGLELLRRLRSAGSTVDVVAVTSVRDLEMVRSMAALGVMHYLVKPFAFSQLRERLEAYRDFHDKARDARGAATQQQIDALLHASRPAVTSPLPKGLSRTTLEIVLTEVRGSPGMSAAEVAARLGMSRVAVRRYLEFLAEEGGLERRARYGTPGRPENEYRWRSSHLG